MFISKLRARYPHLPWRRIFWHLSWATTLPPDILIKKLVSEGLSPTDAKSAIYYTIYEGFTLG